MSDYPITYQSVEVLVKMNETLLDMVAILFMGVKSAPEHPVCKAAVLEATGHLVELKKLQGFAALLCADMSDVPARPLRIVGDSVVTDSGSE